MRGILMAVALGAAVHWPAHHTAFFAGTALAGLAFGVAALLPRRRRVGNAVVTLAGLPALTLMQAHSGGVGSGYGVLLVLAIVWLGLDGRGHEHAAALVVLAACCCVPMLAVGAPAYPVSWDDAGLLMVTGATVIATLRALGVESRSLTRRLEQEALLDELTGLLNRRGWRYTAPRELARATRDGNPIALLTLDLDELKRLNDRFGHWEGDRVLHDTAVRIRDTLRAGDVIARVGGDEFVALLTDSTLAGTLTALERLREITPAEGAFSAGVAVWDRSEDLQELVNRSDRALYAAKAAGGGRTEVAEQSVVLADG